MKTCICCAASKVQPQIVNHNNDELKHMPPDSPKSIACLDKESTASSISFDETYDCSNVVFDCVFDSCGPRQIPQIVDYKVTNTGESSESKDKNMGLTSKDCVCPECGYGVLNLSSSKERTPLLQLPSFIKYGKSFRFWKRKKSATNLPKKIESISSLNSIDENKSMDSDILNKPMDLSILDNYLSYTSPKSRLNSDGDLSSSDATLQESLGDVSDVSFVAEEFSESSVHYDERSQSSEMSFNESDFIENDSLVITFQNSGVELAPITEEDSCSCDEESDRI